MIYADFLPRALADRRRVTAPDPLVVGEGLGPNAVSDGDSKERRWSLAAPVSTVKQ